FFIRAILPTAVSPNGLGISSYEGSVTNLLFGRSQMSLGYPIMWPPEEKCARFFRHLQIVANPPGISHISDVSVYFISHRRPHLDRAGLAREASLCLDNSYRESKPVLHLPQD